ncbi:type ISP restriction/modification enzyme [Lentzea sp. BCCO 10_0798]|uniref:site-specific DNA-methyltransferase (adenine-specific) n=1 Tax=Lentzea kristufekii TaxID=3095430 RepID=A0ABU4TW12_9PSEU|nr:type ISP restriction/modification enzyme [Lentzea sp. BCCO 10_0798]MDX8052476.1 type ISP restriction/modification enzyme [Lentzea sp. BCCO 10_0798]
MGRPARRRSPLDADEFAAAVSEYGSALLPRMRGDGRNEDRLRLPMSKLFERLGDIVGLRVHVHDEVTITELSSRPDIAVDVPSGRVGYVELKAPGKGTPETSAWRPHKHDREQWEKLKALPNLIYTDGSSFARYEKGSLVGSVAKLDGDLSRAGSRLTASDGFERLIRDFLFWRPPEPRSLRTIVTEVAPLCRLLRDQVLETLQKEKSTPGRKPFTGLASEWRDVLFPNPDGRDNDTNFADSYAQAVTFALLLARVDGINFEGRTPWAIAEQLAKKHSLLGAALAMLANPKWVGHLNVVDSLVRVIGNVDWTHIQLGDADTYARLYETFLDDYDPALRRQSGTYYTPAPVARSMVAFVDQILKKRLGKKQGFAARDVTALDPAMGAGTFLAEVLESAASTLRRIRNSDAVPAAHLRELFANRLVGFELQAAPFAVAELRLHATLKSRYQVELPKDEPRFLTNALDNPYDQPFPLGQLYEVLMESREKANHHKRNTPVMVVIGNPPWREKAHGAAPWLEQRRDPRKPIDTSNRPSLDEFRVPGAGRHEFNLSNMWTYFWRWSVWKAFEANDPAGVVALITPSAYLTSKAYAGMRQYLRRTADEGWIIDLSPEEHRADTSTRIFPVTQHKICIGIFVRAGDPQPETPATVHYQALPGTQAEKFAALAELSLDSGWSDCSTGWQAALRPSDDAWETYPALGDLMPWQQPGITPNRNWVHAPDADTLFERWARLVHADKAEKPALFKETQDRTVSDNVRAQPGLPAGGGPVAAEKDLRPPLVRLAYRSFDRQVLIHDRRLIDRPRPHLWQVSGPRQVYVTEQHAHSISEGIALHFAADIPDAHCFNGRGGRVLPLYRDPHGTIPNVVPQLLTALRRFAGTPVGAEDLLAYIAAITAHPGYTRRFREQLKTPGIRVPITLDTHLWRRGVEAGRKVIWLHTFGERMVDPAAGRPQGIPDDAKPSPVSPVPSGDGQIPCSARLDEATETLVLGEDTLFQEAGCIRPVSRAVWNYSTGGMSVVRKWLSYRQSNPKHRKRTSELDDINPQRWTAQFDEELLELLAVLDMCVRLEPEQDELLDEVIKGPLVTVTDLEQEGVLPTPAVYRKPPKEGAPPLL